ncbi:MAG: hypothetical protein NZ455_07830 [Bacteroidia bacterium]|nr:hypothetical protein [Bacteroidia bacterium]
MREACGGRASARCGAKRSTEAIAQPAARRPERSEGTRPKNKKTPLSKNMHYLEAIPASEVQPLSPSSK